MQSQQTLNKLAQEIAAGYSVDQAEWQKAAANLRQPYWDWAVNVYPPDEVITLGQLTITGKDGKKIKVDNPLLRYKFHPIDDSFVNSEDGLFKTWPTTLRWPDPQDPNATDDIKQMHRVLAANHFGVVSATYNMFIHLDDWESFSNHTATTTDKKYNSLETIHDNLHGYMGGSGHVARLEYAGFDPLFYMHHCNIDRMLSLWCAIHPDVWVTNGEAQDGTFTIPAHSPVDVNTPLTPFWHQPTGSIRVIGQHGTPAQPTESKLFWTSSGLKTLDSLGYTYPEFVGLDMGNKETVRTKILRVVNNLYSPIWTRPFTDAFKAKVGRPIESTIQGIFLQADDQPELSVFDWVVRVRFKKYELGTSFYIVFFLGDVPTNPEEWLGSENLVGSHYAFVNRSVENCANCRSRLDMVQEGFIQLNQGIVKHSKLNSFHPDVVAPYVKDKMQWRVVKADGTTLELPSLEVVVFDVPLTLPPGADVPIAHRSSSLPDGIILRRSATDRA